MQCRPLPRAEREPGREREHGRWRVGGKGVNSSLCWEREKREALVVCLHVRASLLSLIKSVYVGLYIEILGVQVLYCK